MVSRSPSIIQPAGMGWRNQVVVPDGPCGCAMPVRADCYYQCCPHCGIRPLCLLSKLHRMLDCLLPCNRCCGGFAHGCMLGGRYGGCGGCGADMGCVPGCSSAVPGLSDPFQDDPVPAPPKPQPASEVRRAPPRGLSPALLANKRLATSSQHMSWKTAGRNHATGPIVEKQATEPQKSPYVIAQPVRPAEQSILRRTSLENNSGEPAPLKLDSRSARPIVRSQSPPEDEIPFNPLRK
jgi:hypothetical protein